MIRSFAAPYVKAFSEVYADPARATALHDELDRFARAVSGHAELYEVLENPAVDADVKRNIANKVAQQLQISPEGLKILGVLAGNQRLHQLGDILEAWLELIHRQTGTVVAQVRAAHALTPAERDQLRAALEKKTGSKVAMEVTTDPSLLAGFVAQIGSELFDASVAGQIRRLETLN